MKGYKVTTMLNAIKKSEEFVWSGGLDGAFLKMWWYSQDVNMNRNSWGKEERRSRRMSVHKVPVVRASKELLMKWKIINDSVVRKQEGVWDDSKLLRYCFVRPTKELVCFCYKSLRKTSRWSKWIMIRSSCVWKCQSAWYVINGKTRVRVMRKEHFKAIAIVQMKDNGSINEIWGLSE